MLIQAMLEEESQKKRRKSNASRRTSQVPEIRASVQPIPLDKKASISQVANE